MQTQIIITRHDDKVFISAPFCQQNNVIFRNKGGKFLSNKWVFPDTETVSEMIRELFGLSTELVVIKIAKSHDLLKAGGGEYVVGGYKVASRRFRDSAVEWPLGTWLISGNIPSSGGSQKNPAVQADDDSTFGVVVRRDFAEKNGLEIIKRASQNTDALLQEKQTLLARIAEIDKLLEA